MREAAPGPMLSAYATRSPIASMSRKSSFSVPGIVDRCQLSPPFVVRIIVPFAPLAQTTRSLTALTPRSRAVTPLVCGVQVGVAASTAPRRPMAPLRTRGRAEARSHTACCNWLFDISDGHGSAALARPRRGDTDSQRFEAIVDRDRRLPVALHVL